MLMQCRRQNPAHRGNHSVAQDQREEGLKGFRDGTFHVLVATDVAGRGIDVPDARFPIIELALIFEKVDTEVIGSLPRAGRRQRRRLHHGCPDEPSAQLQPCTRSARCRRLPRLCCWLLSRGPLCMAAPSVSAQQPEPVCRRPCSISKTVANSNSTMVDVSGQVAMVVKLRHAQFHRGLHAPHRCQLMYLFTSNMCDCRWRWL